MAMFLILLLGVVHAMPSLEQSLFCYIPTAEVSAAFAKTISSVSYASAQLVSAASDGGAVLYTYTEGPAHTAPWGLSFLL